ncbi:MAG TPA: hypothetical protein VF799_02310 [Geobacteraceae bacterium]
MKFLATLIAITLLLSTNPLPVVAATLTAISGGLDAVVMAADNDISGVERIELTYSYPEGFALPKVDVQGGEYSEEQMLRDSKPGSLKLAINRVGEEALEAGFLLIVKFAKKPDYRAYPVNSVTAKYYYANGDTVQPEVDLSALEEMKKRAATPVAGKPATAHPVDSVKPVATGSSKEGEHVLDRQKSGKLDHEEHVTDGLNPVYQACPEPLQRFADHGGDRSMAALISLLASDNPCAFEQTPAVAISDGVSKVVVTLRLEASTYAPNFGVSGARLVNIWKDPDSKWRIELLPEQGKHDVALYVCTGRVMKRIPLIVAPPLALYLKELNPEEKLSPLLEYVIAANYLAMHRETVAKADNKPR